MFKSIITLFIVLMYFINIRGQDTAMVSIPFNMYDNGGGQRTLYLGADSTATDSIDSNLGETDLPPFPPSGVFEARWILPAGEFNGTLSSYIDYRYEEAIPFADTIEYRLKYQGKEAADTMFFAWNFPAGITARMQDIITGTITDVFMSDSGVYGLANFDALNQMKLSVYFNVVPVELTSFTAAAAGRDIILNWSTATETNNRGFEIERSKRSNVKSQNVWEKIGFVSGIGTTTEQHNYTYTDKNLGNGKYYYRLKQVDYDGSWEFSNIVEVDFNAINSYQLEQNYPNPFNPTTTIGFSVPAKSNVKITILNVIGEEVAVVMNEQKEAGYHQVEFNAANLPSGVYFYQLRARDYTSIKKMILLK